MKDDNWRLQYREDTLALTEEDCVLTRCNRLSRVPNEPDHDSASNIYMQKRNRGTDESVFLFGVSKDVVLDHTALNVDVTPAYNLAVAQHVQFSPSLRRVIYSTQLLLLELLHAFLLLPTG